MTLLKKKYGDFLRQQCDNYEIPYKICSGIIQIETTYRKRYFRICEYVVLMISIVLNLLLKRPIKNYTIGICQVGISTILSYYGKNTYQHLEKINRLSFCDAYNIMKAIYYKNNILVFCYRISCICGKSYFEKYSESQQAQIVGEEYNGKYLYGLRLQALVEDMLRDEGVSYPNKG
ncbi:MAG: hypothetical protein E7401_03180 [Ruminococcaceae bacterium]|nr:hypothetical protein [Oscillospiraceae bacterium]